MQISEQLKDMLAVGMALTVLVLFSVWHPTTGDLVSSPSYWGDEAVSVEKARNFLTYGRLDISVAPGVFSEKPYATAAAGPLLTLPLAGFFSLFGIGIAQVRIYMLLWLVALVVISFFFVRAVAGRRAAMVSVLLIATFSPLYANGKTATGDIPGFVALLVALYYLYVRRWYFFSGILLGIAITTKPSLYLPLIIVALMELVISESHARMKHIGALVCGSLIVLLPWAVSLVSEPRMVASWQEAYAFFKNPFPADATSVIDSIKGWDVTGLLHTTILHYAILGCIAILAVWYTRQKEEAWVRLLRFSALYALIAFVLYLRSPGWLRYLLGGILLLFLVIVPALHSLLHQRTWWYYIPSWAGSAILFLLISGQVIHILFFSWRTASDVPMQDSAFLQNLLQPGETIGFMDVPTLASLIDSRQKYQVVRISGNTVLGKNPLAYESDRLPTYIFISKNRFQKGENEFVTPYTHVLNAQYANMELSTQRYIIYKKK